MSTHPTLSKLAAMRTRLLAVVSDLPDSALDRRAPDGWSIRDVLTHLINAEQDHCRVIAIITGGDAHLLPTEFSLDEHNAQRLAERGHLTRDELLAGLAAQRANTEAMFHSLSADHLAMRGRHPALGEMAAGDIFRILAVHEQMHLRDIEALLNAPDQGE